MTPLHRRTEHLDLRPVTESDLDALCAIHTDPRTNQFRPGGAPDRPECERLLAEFVEGWRRHGVGYWTVRAGDRVVGCAGVKSFLFRDRQSWNLYYRFEPESWGRGFATEVARETVRFVEAELDPRPVVARTRPTNTAAIAVAERAGLTRRQDLDSDGFAVLTRGW